MFRTNDSKVEKGRVAAHEGAETGVEKLHHLIDRVAEQAETGSEKAAAAGAAAQVKGRDLRAQAEQAREDARKDLAKGKKKAEKKRKNAKKRGKKASSELHDLRDTFVDDVLPKVAATATGLAAAGAAAGQDLADEAGKRAPAAFNALKDDQDPQAALAAIKGETTKKARGKKLFLLAIIAGGVAAYFAKKSQEPKKDPWAVPAGDPYKAPETGRDSSFKPSDGPAGTTSSTGPTSAAGAGAVGAGGVVLCGLQL